jgi:membrane peptidoglycan carboxypeptidase
MLEGVVESGSGARAAVPGYRLAGKTGTAKKVASGGYSETDHMASFVGFGPSRAQRLVTLVVLDTPRGSHQGGQVAAPVFARIMADALRHLHVPADEQPRPGEMARLAARIPGEPATLDRDPPAPGAVPDLRGLSLREAVALLAQHGYRAQVEGHGFVTEQEPAAGTTLARASTCRLRLAEATWEKEES